MDRFKAFVREKGLYLLCLAVAFAATAAGILALRRIVGHLTGQPDAASGLVEQDTLWEQPDTAVEKSVVDIPKPTQTPTPAPTATPQPTPQPQRAAESQVPQQAVRPRPAWYGKAVTAFSGDELVYNATLGDWRTHNGADYTVPEGKAITPAVGGTVTAVRSDLLWGNVVEITDSSDIVWRYCGLRQTQVAQGEKVTQDTTLAVLGSLPAEAHVGSHLHLECLQHGKYLDPAEVMGGN